MERTRTRAPARLATLATSLILVAFAGCGNQPAPPAAPANQAVAPVGSQTVAPVGSRALAAAQVAGNDADLAPAPIVAGLRSPLGDPPAPAAEPAMAPDRSTPTKLMGSLVDALNARDLAALARLRLEIADKPALDANDLARAERDFFGPNRQSYWTRVLAGVTPQQLDALDTSTQTVAVKSAVGGALGSVELVFRKGVEGWVLR